MVELKRPERIQQIQTPKYLFFLRRKKRTTYLSYGRTGKKKRYRGRTKRTKQKIDRAKQNSDNVKCRGRDDDEYMMIRQWTMID